VRRVLLSAFLLAAPCARAAGPDAPFVAPLPATTPEEGLARLRADAARGRDAAALGDAYDFLKRYPGDPDRDEVALAAGALHLRRGEADRAVRFLAPLARSGDPRVRSAAIHLLGGALTALGKDAAVLKAVPAADPAATRDRWLALAQVWRAAALDRLGRHAEAAEVYRALAASGIDSPVRAYALAAVGKDWDRKGRPERARDDFVRAGESADKHGLESLRDALALAAANEYARERKLDDAAAAYARFVRRFPDSPLATRALYERGLALKRLGLHPDAAAAFEALLKRDPSSAFAPDAHLQLGQLYTELGRADDALAQYRAMGRTSEAAGAGREALLLSAQVFYNDKRWADAVPLYRRWLEGAPSGAKTREVEGLLLVCLWQSDRDDPELATLAERIPEHPLVARIRRELAAKAYRRGDWAGAADLFAREYRADPRAKGAPEALFYRAEALRQLGRAKEAAAAYAAFLKAASQDPRAPDAGYGRALSLSKADPAASAPWEEFAARFPKDARASAAWWEAARRREAARDWDSAARDYERAGGPAEKAKSLYALGRLRERLKRTGQARAAYEALRAAKPANDPARLAGLLRLGLLLELDDKPRDAAPLYAEILRLAPKGSARFETARKRLEALTSGNALLGGRAPRSKGRDTRP
jgi:tetratricopeptide (TPR) repeat protein